jgi:hypothetical protein
MLQADEAARVACGPADGKVIRNMRASYQDPRWDCISIGGYRCSLGGKALCRYQQKVRAPACGASGEPQFVFWIGAQLETPTPTVWRPVSAMTVSRSSRDTR